MRCNWQHAARECHRLCACGKVISSETLAELDAAARKRETDKLVQRVTDALSGANPLAGYVTGHNKLSRLSGGTSPFEDQLAKQNRLTDFLSSNPFGDQLAKQAKLSEALDKKIRKYQDSLHKLNELNLGASTESENDEGSSNGSEDD